MSQQYFTVLKWGVITMLVLSIGFGCKKETSIENLYHQSPSTPSNNQSSLDILKNLVLIPGTNSFIMGSPSTEVGRNSDEIQHEVALSSFYISKYELSRGEFKPFLQSKDTNYLAPDQRRIANYSITGWNWNATDAHPIVNISWNTALRYCNWGTKQTGSNDTAYIFNADGSFNSWNTNSKGIRLPTESEWEYACKANTTTPFASGNNITTAQANYNGNFPYNGNPTGIYIKHPIPVDTATYFKNTFGLEHMHGNVWEWCYDWYGTYHTTKQTNPIGATTGSNRVVRGGSLDDYGMDLRSAVRSGGSPGFRGNHVGFRLAKTM